MAAAWSEEPTRLGLIGVPFNSAGLPGGEARGPAALRAAGLLAALGRAGDVIDYGDVLFEEPTPERDPASGIVAPRVLARMVAATGEAVGRVLADGRLPVVVGGECPLLLGCLAAARDAHGEVGLLFVDGHEDAWPPHRSTTGEAADMELGFALGATAPQDNPDVADLAALLPLVRPADTVVLGPRDAAELAEAGLPSVAAGGDLLAFLAAAAVRGQDVGAIARGLVSRLGANGGSWWFHLGLDALSTEALAAVRYRQPGGFGWEDLERIAAAAFATPGLVGWNLTIYNPDLDPDGSGAERIVAFVGEAVAQMAG